MFIPNRVSSINIVNTEPNEPNIRTYDPVKYNNSQNSNSIKPGRRIKLGTVNEQQAELELGKRVTLTDELELTEENSEFEQKLEPVFKPRTSLFNLKGIFVVSLLALILVETGYTIAEAIEQSILFKHVWGK